MAAPREGDWGLIPQNPKGRQKLSKKNGIRLVGYIFRLKNYVKISLSFVRFFRAGAATAVFLTHTCKKAQISIEGNEQISIEGILLFPEKKTKFNITLQLERTFLNSAREKIDLKS